MDGRKLRMLSACAIGVLAFTLGSCGYGHQPATKAHVVHHVDASWADGYPTVSAMTAHADLVISGTIGRVQSRGRFTNASANTAGAPAAGVPYTQYWVSVAEIIKGRSPSRLTIRQTGGRAADGSTVVVEDDPLLVPGQRAILFLKRFGPGQYFIMGGPAGRFPISSAGVVTALPGGSLTKPPSGSVARFMRAIHEAARAEH